MLFPLTDVSGKPLVPINHNRFFKMVKARKITPFMKKGFLCGRLNKLVIEPPVETGSCIIGIDPGSKRTGITVICNNKVVLNIQCNAPDWIKKKMEIRRNYRRSRRYRNTPYRKCRPNRARSAGFVPPSTKARWQAHLRMIKFLKTILPLNMVVIEDIKAMSKKNCRKWNVNFSPLEVGKKWFEEQIENLGLKFFKKQGWETFGWRKYKQYKKTKNKLAERWEAHCVDSHSLCEMIVGEVKPKKNLKILNFLRFNRRELHKGFTKDGVRKSYGSTKSMGFNRGSILNHEKWGICYLGGTSRNRVSLHELETGKRLSHKVKINDCKILTNNSWRICHIASI